jgi:hypothetical protein
LVPANQAQTTYACEQPDRIGSIVRVDYLIDVFAQGLVAKSDVHSLSFRMKVMGVFANFTNADS